MEFFLSKLEARFNSASELKSDLDRLNGALPRTSILMDKAEWLRFKDENVAELLTQLRDAAYDAEDVIAEFKYYDLQQEIEGKATLWQSVATFIDDLVSNRANKVKEIQARLDYATTELEKAIDMLGSLVGPTPHGKAVQRETSSLLTKPVLGREKEVEQVVGYMLEPHNGDKLMSNNEASDSSPNQSKRRKTGNISILPIVGIGGVGKTTLAQLIYNDERVKNHFDMRIWVCVSDQFDLKRITKEMIESANRESINSEGQYGISDNVTNLDTLQKILQEKVESRRYLLVLDDVWHENRQDLESLCNPLQSGLQGSMILITTRLAKAANTVYTLDPIKLGGLPDDIYWDFFKSCVFGSSDPNSSELLEIGKEIASRLKGSPLAAKTLGGILCANMTPEQWRNISDSELWELEQGDDGIFAALRVSYQYLPVHLKRCFLICSLYPKDYPLGLNGLSPIWMADGIITQDKNHLFENNKGSEYFLDLKGRNFFTRGQYNAYHVHDLMHDLAKSLSLDTCYCQEGDTWKLKSNNRVRHLSVYRKSIDSIEKEIGTCNKLRSLQFLNGFPNEIKLGPQTLAFLFNQLPFLRILDLGHCKIEKLPDDIGKLKLLFNINLNTTRIKSLPEPICQLYNLEVLNVERCPIQSFPKSFHRLIKLKLIAHTMDISLMIPGIGKLTFLEKLLSFKVLQEKGHKIEELKNMTRLRGGLKISNLENVENGADAARACLDNKKHLTELTLSWSYCRNIDFGTLVSGIDEKILENLKPHPNLKCLFIENCGGRTLPSWLQIENLPHLCELGIRGCLNLENLESWFVPNKSPPVQTLEIQGCVNLPSLPVEWFKRSSLSRLKITNCPLLSSSSNLILPPSLSILQLESCGGLDKSLPSCLENLCSLHFLELNNCQHVASLPSQVTCHLRYLRLSNCVELQFLELSCLLTLEVLKIDKCPKLIQKDPLTSNNETLPQRIKELRKLHIDNTSLLKLPFLRNPPYYIGQLKISNSDEEKMFMGDLKGWLNGLEKLEELIFDVCTNLESIPEELKSVKRIEIRNCLKIQCLPESDLPSSLSIRCLGGCHPVLIAQVSQRKTTMEYERGESKRLVRMDSD